MIKNIDTVKRLREYYLAQNVHTLLKIHKGKSIFIESIFYIDLLLGDMASHNTPNKAVGCISRPVNFHMKGEING